MAYTPFYDPDPWDDQIEDGSGNVTHQSTTPITAAALDYIEAGIVSVSNAVGISGASIWEFTTSGALSVGDSTVTLSRSASPIVKGRSLLIVIDPFTIGCEVREVAALSGSTLTMQTALTRSHSDGVIALLVADDTLNVILWGADCQNNNAVDDWAPLQVGMNQTVLNACWLQGGGQSCKVRAPLFGSNGTRLKQMNGITAHSTLYTPAETSNAMFMSAQNTWQPFTALASTNTFTTTAATGVGAGQKVAFNCPYGETLPGGIVAGRVYWCKTTPTSTSFTISATDGGAEIDITSDGAGITYTGINSLERIFFDQVKFTGSSIANINGVSAYLQQPAYTRNLRIDGCKGTGLILSGQISNHYNLEIDPGIGGAGVGIKLSGLGHNFYGTNITDTTGNVSDGIHMGAGLQTYAQDNNFYGLWLENLTVGIHFVGTSLGCSFHGIGATSPCTLKVDSAVAPVNNSYIMTGNLSGVSTPAIKDDARGYTVNWSDLPQNTLTSWTQLAGELAPQLGGKNYVQKTTAYTATLADEVINCHASGGAFSVTLPAAAHIGGKTYTITKIDSSGNAVTVDANASETINGATTKVLAAQYDTVTIISNGTAWYIA